MKQGLRKSKSTLIMVVGSFLVGMSLFFSACNLNTSPSTYAGPIGGSGRYGGIGSGPPNSGSNSNYVVGAVGYGITSYGATGITTYTFSADIASNNNPITTAAVTFTDPNGTTKYPLIYTGSNQAVGSVTCGTYEGSPSSFTTVGVFNLSVVTASGISSGSVTAINSVVTFPSPYTSISWTGSSQQNALAVVSVATPSTTYSQSSSTSPINIPASTYTSGVTYSYSLVQTNQNATINGGTGLVEYLQMSNGTFVAP